MPGVSTFPGVRPGRSAGRDAPAAAYAPAGKTERGPVDTTVECFSLAEYEAAYGGKFGGGAVWESVQLYFEEGGVRVLPARAVGPDATKGSLDLPNRLSVSPVDCLSIEARDPGPRSVDIGIRVLAGTPSSTFTINVYVNGAFKEEFTNLVSVPAAVTALLRSNWVRGIPLTDPTASPNNVPAPTAGTTPVALSAGDDDLDAVLVAQVAEAADRILTEDYESCFVAFPGYTPAQAGPLLRAHALKYHREVGVALPLGTEPDDVLGVVESSRNTLAAGLPAYANGMENLDYVWPGVVVTTEGVRRTITAEGYVAAKRSIACVEEGPWASAAGERGATLGFVTDLEYRVGKAVGDALDAGRVSVIRMIQRSPRLYGYRSAHPDADLFYELGVAGGRNYAQYELARRAEPIVHKQNGGAGASVGKGVLVGRLVAIATALGAELARAGALYPAADGSDEGYKVEGGAALNNPAAAARREVGVRLGLRFGPSAANVMVYVDVAAPTAAL